MWLSRNEPTSIHKNAGYWELWCRLAAAAPIQPLAWELPYTAGTALKSKKIKKEKEKRKNIMKLKI